MQRMQQLPLFAGADAPAAAAAAGMLQLASPCLSAVPPRRDIIARFGGDPTYQLPWQFYDDFVTVG